MEKLSLVNLIFGGHQINKLTKRKRYLLIPKYFFLVLIKSIIITFFISLIIFIIINSAPGAADFLNQPFLHWYFKILMLNVDSVNGQSPQISSYIFADLWFSFKYIFLSVSFALMIAVLFLYFRKSKIFNNCMIQPILTFSFLHLIFFYWLIKDISFIYPDLLLIISLAIGSGVFYDYYSLLTNEHDNIINKDYNLFASYSGYNIYKFAQKELITNLVIITLSRLPILFSGMIIIEVFTRGETLSYTGIGFRIWYSIEQYHITANPTYFQITLTATVLSIFIFTFIFFIIEEIKLKNR